MQNPHRTLIFVVFQNIEKIFQVLELYPQPWLSLLNKPEMKREKESTISKQ